MTAALETAGYRAQEMVLRDLAPLINGIAIFILVATALSAIITFALQGEYKGALWFLIGPAIFYFVTRSTTEAGPIEWQMGAFNAGTKDVETLAGEKEGAKSKVAVVFHLYDRLVSSVIQETVRIFTDDKVKKQMMFMTRQKMTDFIMRADLQNGGLEALITTGTQGECHEAMEAGRQLALGNRDPEFRTTPAHRDAVVVYNKKARSSEIMLTQEPVRGYLVNLIKAVRTESSKGEVTQRFCSSEDRAEILSGNRPEDIVGNPLNCEMIWCLTGFGLAQEAGAIQKNGEDQLLSKYMKEKNPELVQQMWHDIAVKLTPPDLSTLPDAQPDNKSVIPVVISGILLRKTLQQDPQQTKFAQVVDHSGIQTRAYTMDFGKMDKEQVMDYGRRGNMWTEAEATKYEIYYYSLAIPYVQGLLLYALAVMFPFFAILLMVPGKASAFFTWMALWTWVKLWDVGWALVMVADNILWNLMPHTAVIHPTLDPSHAPLTVFEAAFTNDPAYSLANYYMLLSVMLYAVPVMTAQITLGAKGAIGGIIMNGLRGMGQKMNGRVADWVSVEQQQHLNKAWDHYRVNYVTSRALKDNPEYYKGPLGDELKGQRAQAEKQLSEGTRMRGWGWGTAAVGVVGGIALAPVALPAALLVGVGGYIGGSSWAKAGVKKQRLGNAMRAAVTRRNVELLQKQSDYSQFSINMNMAMTMIGRRQEHWRVTAHGQPSEIMRQQAEFNVGINEADGYKWGGIGQALFKGTGAALTGGGNLL